MGEQIIYVTGDFNWLKNIVKNSQKLLNILRQKKNYYFFCISIKMNTFALFTAEVWKK